MGGMMTQIMIKMKEQTKSVFLVPTKQRMPSLYKQKSLQLLTDDLVTH